jgi:hypothetical protein
MPGSVDERAHCLSRQVCGDQNERDPGDLLGTLLGASGALVVAPLLRAESAYQEHRD